MSREQCVQNMRQKVDIRLSTLDRNRTWLAEQSGIHLQSIAAVLRTQWPKTKTLAALADALRLDVRVFFDPGFPAALLEIPDDFTDKD